MRTFYLSGPMTGLPFWNFPEFDQAREYLRNEGFSVICPAERDRRLGFDESSDVWPDELHDQAARGDAIAIAGADAIAVLPGWMKSTGCRVELTLARWIGLPVVRALDPHGPDISGTVDEWLAGDGIPGYEERPEAAHDLPSPVVLERTAEAQRGHDAKVAEALRTVGITEEFRVVDPETGGEKGTKLARFDLLPTGALWQIAERFGRGAEKYEARNWERGYAWSLSYAALCRHLFAWWSGEDVDEEFGDSHLAAVGFHALALLHFAENFPEGDDRP